MSSSSSVQRTTIILTGPNDWDEWLEVIKTKAEAGKIWEYVNPAVPKESLKVLTRPEVPKPKDVNPQKNTIAELTADELDELKLLRYNFKHQLQLFERQDVALSTVKALVQETISRIFLTYTFKKESTYDVLIALRQRVAPTDRARKLELSQRYGRLKKAPRSQNVEAWLQSWEQTYTDCKELKLPVVEDNLPLYDLLSAVAEIAPEFSSVWTVKLQTKEMDNKPLPDIFRLINLFRDHQRLANTSRSKDSGAFPATLKDQPLAHNPGTKDPKDPKLDSKKRHCICGVEHLFSACPYLIESIRPSGWTADPETQKKVDEKLKMPNVKAGVEKARRWVAKGLAQKGQDSQGGSQGSSTPQALEKAGAFVVSCYSAPKSNSSDYDLRNSFILDSGATVHVCNTRDRFYNFVPASEDDLLYAGNTVIPIEGFGSVDVTVQTPSGPKLIELQHTALVTSFHTSVVSLKRIVSKRVYWDMEHHRLTKEGETFCTVQTHHDQWVLEFNPSADLSAFAAWSAQPRPIVGASPLIWHLRLGHPNADIVNHLPESVIDVKTEKAPTKIECETCSVSKAQAVISRRPAIQPSAPYEQVAFDLVQMTNGHNDDWMFLHLLCLRTQMNHVYTLTNKRQTTLVNILKEFTAFVQTRYDCTVRRLRTDGEKSLGDDFTNWVKAKGLTFEPSAPYTPEQNGAAERSGGVIIQRARAMRVHARLPEELWPEIVTAAAYILNRTPNRQLNWKTPLETLQEAAKIPNPHSSIAHLRVYGARAYPLIRKIPKTEKLKPRAHIGYLVGYDSTNIFRIWIPSKKKVIRTRDVTFNETLFYDPGTPDISELLQLEAEQIIEVVNLATSQPLVDALDIDTDSDSEIELSSGSCTTIEGSQSHQTEKIQEESNVINTHDNTHLPTPSDTDSIISDASEGTPMGDQSGIPSTETTHSDRKPGHKNSEISSDISENLIITTQRTRKLPRRYAYLTTLQKPEKLQAYLAAFASGLARPHRNQLPPEPRSWRELQRHPYRDGFRAAAEKEYRDLERHQTFCLVPNSPGRKLLPLIWTFVYKFDTDGYLVKYKARLCARGDLQEPSHLNTYATTLATRVFRTLMAIMAAFDLEARHYDVVNAFTNSTLDETVYCHCPEGYKTEGSSLLLLKALYGLRRSPILWLKEFSRSLREMGLQEVPGEPCLFVNKWLIIFFYVDDIVVLGRKEHLAHFDEFEKKLRARYEIRALGELTWFLGIRLLRDREAHKVWLCQDSYIDKIVTRFHLEHHKLASTPLPLDDLLPYEGEATPQEIHAYQERVGSINFPAVVTRPDIAFTASLLSTFLCNPSPAHLAAADRAITYLNRTKTYAIEYSAPPGSEQEVFFGASDAAFADDSQTRKSTGGFLYKLFGGPTDWHSGKQKTVTTSSTEAELLALSRAAKETIWWRRLFNQISFNPGHELTVHCDNQQTIRLLTQEAQKLDTKLRHIDIHQHWLRQEVQARRLRIKWIPTSDMPADGFTKALSRQRHERFIKQLNLIDIKPLLSTGQAASCNAQEAGGVCQPSEPQCARMSEKASTN
jgi:hypothetical protein